jgi:hypothetical protein
MKSPIYWHPLIYNAAMRYAYGKHFLDRYSEVAGLVPDGVSVHEVCAGNFYLFLRGLRGRNVEYTGSDLNRGFVRAARVRGIEARCMNLLRDPIPSADILIMHGSLYQFMPRHLEVVDAMLAASRLSTIVAEPIVNFSTSGHPLLAFLARRLTDPGSGPKPERFTEKSLDDFMYGRYGERIERTAHIAGGREKLFVLNAAGPAAAGNTVG